MSSKFLFLLGIAVCLAFMADLTACEIFAVIGLDDHTLLSDPQDTAQSTDIRNLFTYFGVLGQNTNRDGLGITFYENTSLHTSPGRIQTSDSFTVSDRRSATLPHRTVPAPETYYPQEDRLTVLEQDFYYQNIRIAVAHKRNASTGSRTIPNPHPWVYRTAERSYSFIHNGTVYSSQLNHINSFYTDPANGYLRDAQIDSLYNVGVVAGQNVPVDSGVFFVYLMLQIKAQNMDVLAGLHVALSNLVGINSPQRKELNFILSDGEAIYAYRYAPVSIYTYYLPERNLALLASRNDATNYIYLPQFLEGKEYHYTSLSDDMLMVFSGNSTPVTYTTFSAGYSSSTDNTQTIPISKHYVYPNPFNPSTTIAFHLTIPNLVNVSIYNLKGQRVKTLQENTLPEGDHYVVWNGRDELYHPVASGVYLYRITTPKGQKMGKMVLGK